MASGLEELKVLWGGSGKMGRGKDMVPLGVLNKQSRS